MTADMDSRLAIDTAVLLLYFIIIIFIGLYMGRKEESLKDFALGGRAIPWWAVLASIIAAETSAHLFRYAGRRLPRAQLHLFATGARHHSGAHPGQLHFHQALLRLQSLFDLRISHSAFWRADEERRVSYFSGYARAGVRC